MKFGFVIDNRKCIGCHACTVACKSEHDVPIGVNRTWVKYVEKGTFPDTRRLFSVMRCNHCSDAPCVDICPVTALYKRADGIVDFDNRRCIGCKACMQACPYDALYIDPETQTAAKCNYCAHRVDIGLEAACVNVCPEHAIVSGDMHNPLSEISQLLAREQVTTRKSEKGTQPNVFYIEGDQATLNPDIAEPATSYLWSSQATGVGHFARYAEARITSASPSNRTPLPAANRGTNDPGDAAARVLVPTVGDDKKNLEKAADVVQETAARTYDAPGKGVLWGWEVSAYVWTKAISTGAFLAPFLATVFGFAQLTEMMRWAGLATAIIFLLLTTGLLIKDLDKPARFAYILLRPQWRSWLVRGGYAITFYGIFLIWHGLAIASDWHSVLSLTGWASAVFAIITAIYTAFLFAQASGRDFWQSPTLSLHMLLHAMMAGAAIFCIGALFSAPETAWHEYLTRLVYCTSAFNLLVTALELATKHPTGDAQKTVKMIVSGKFSPVFWVGVVCAGNLIPGLLLWLGGSLSMALAGGLLLLGIYLVEYIWVRAPQLLPLS